MEYTIKAGKHYSGMFRKFKFSSNCVYNLNGIDQYDINKLFGWSQLYHEDNSCRIGWSWNLTSNSMDVYSYCHVDKKIVSQKLCTCKLDTWYIGQIWLDKNQYYFRILDADNNNILGYDIIPSDYKVNLGYTLKPFFGGTLVAPHEMNITLENV